MVDHSTPLGKNFNLGEFLRSNVAERDDRLKAEQEDPPESVLNSVAYLVRKVLQPIRHGIGYPIRINSGYRCPMVNKLVGGSATSQHCLGEAADCELSPNFLLDDGTSKIRKDIDAEIFRATGKPPRGKVNENFYLFAYICLHLHDLDIDQVIHEYGEDFGRPSWIHVSAADRQDKRQILFVGSYTNRKYLKYRSATEALAEGMADGEEIVLGGTRTVPPLSPAAGQPDSYGFRAEGEVTVDNLRVRAAPSAELVARPLRRDTRVRVVERKDGWSKVEYVNSGWVSSQYVREF